MLLLTRTTRNNNSFVNELNLTRRIIIMKWRSPCRLPKERVSFNKLLKTGSLIESRRSKKRRKTRIRDLLYRRSKSRSASQSIFRRIRKSSPSIYAKTNIDPKSLETPLITQGTQLFISRNILTILKTVSRTPTTKQTKAWCRPTSLAFMGFPRCPLASPTRGTFPSVTTAVSTGRSRGATVQQTKTLRVCLIALLTRRATKLSRYRGSKNQRTMLPSRTSAFSRKSKT